MSAVQTSRPVLQILDHDECLRLLAAHDFGRLAINLRAEVPMIRPLNYLYDERTQSVVFRTAYGSKLQGVLVAARAAFEIDGIDPVARTGWSVIVVGSVEKVTNHLELERFRAAGPQPWAPGDKPHWARIRAFTVTGRRIAAEPA